MPTRTHAPDTTVGDRGADPGAATTPPPPTCSFRFTDGAPCCLCTHVGDRHRVRPPIEGWAAGSIDADTFLTVWGSAWAPEEGGRVYAIPEAAEARAAHLRARSVPATAETVVVRRVRDEGGVFRIVDKPLHPTCSGAADPQDVVSASAMTPPRRADRPPAHAHAPLHPGAEQRRPSP